MEELFQAIEEAAKEYHEFYRPALEQRKAEVKADEKRLREESLKKLKKDLDVDAKDAGKASATEGQRTAESGSEEAEYNDLMKWIKAVKQEEQQGNAPDGKESVQKDTQKVEPEKK